MSERFDPGWLALRESADAAARDPRLLDRARNWLATRRRPLVITDLGAGAGANPLYLARALPGPQCWRLIDHDAELLDQAVQRLAGQRDADGGIVRFESRATDLYDAQRAIGDDTDLATASALFDLVAADWISGLAARCREVGCSALWTLTIDGQWRFITTDEADEIAFDAPDPGDPGDRTRERKQERDALLDDEAEAEDEAMRALLRAHQSGMKGLGRALGGNAPNALRSAFSSQEYEVFEAPSPWRLPPGSHQGLAVALLDGWRRALHEQAPDATDRIDAWWRDRRTRIENAELGVIVGHVDIYAEPAA